MQYSCTPVLTIIKTHYKSLFSILRVYYQNEPITIDIVYCNTSAINDSSTSTQVFVNKDTLLTNICGMELDK